MMASRVASAHYGCFKRCLNRSITGDDYATQAPSSSDVHKSVKTGDLMETEDILASELSNLSIQERIKAFDDVHCVGDDLKEDGKMVQDSLTKFDHAVGAYKNDVYDIAMNQNRELVEDPSFRLKFLRANLYDVHRSVLQMMEFLRYKALYFGEDKVGRDIVLSDLKPGDIDLLKSGLFHIQEGRDRSGRFILYALTHKFPCAAHDAVIRASYYLIYNLLITLPEVQSKGLVAVYYDTFPPDFDLDYISLNLSLDVCLATASLPYRLSSVHVCLKSGGVFNDTKMAIVMKYALSKYTRARTRLFYGSHLERQYHLQGHGIPLSTCPVNSRGEVRQSILNCWFEKHLAVLNQASGPSVRMQHLSDLSAGEQNRIGSDKPTTFPQGRPALALIGQNYDIVSIQPGGISSSARVEGTRIQPNQGDVLLGRGNVLQKHPGNIRFRTWLEQYQSVYEESPKSQKRSLATAITVEIASCGVRFLKQDDCKQWITVESKEVVEKICQLFRSKRKAKRDWI